MSDGGFTDAQNQAIERVMDIIKEHFDGAIVVFHSETSDTIDTTWVRNHGSALLGVGLAVRAKQYLLDARIVKPGEDSE